MRFCRAFCRQGFYAQFGLAAAPLRKCRWRATAVATPPVHVHTLLRQAPGERMRTTPGLGTPLLRPLTQKAHIFM